MNEQLIVKLQLSGDWHWMVRSADSHIFNRSDRGFESQEACTADARAHGFCTRADARHALNAKRNTRVR